MDKQQVVFLGALFFVNYAVGATQNIENAASNQANIVLSNDLVKQYQSKNTSSTSSVITQIQALRRDGYLTAATKTAIDYLKKYPNDGDIRFILGSIQQEQKEPVLAKKNFIQVLKQYPAYLDARLSLIRIYIAEKKYSEASSLIQEGLKINQKEIRLLSLQRILLTEQAKTKLATLAKQKAEPLILTLEQKNLNKARLYAHKGQYQEQLRFLRLLVASNEKNIAYRLALATYYIEHKDSMLALDVINKGLKIHPKNIDLLLKKGEVNNSLYQYPQAAAAFHEVLQIAPDNTLAPRAIEEINTINPFYNYGINEVGVYTDNAYVQDLHSIWNYSTVYYMRDINKGRIGGHVNFASRLGMNAAQYELDYSPRLTQNTYFDLAAAYSDEPALFPNWMGRGEGFLKVANNAEVSAGIQYSKIASTYLNTYTSSISLYLGNNLLSFRPYFFIPKSNDKSTLYTATVRHYFDMGDHFISISGGSGTSPDIADLLTVNFIIIRNSFINFNYEFPILNHLMVVDLGAGYQRWIYPSQLIRNLYDAKVGVKYRF